MSVEQESVESSSSGATGSSETSRSAIQSPFGRFAWLAFAALTTIAAALLLWQFSSVLLLLVAAIMLAGAIRPMTTWLANHGLRRGLGTVLMVLLIIVAILSGAGLSAFVLAEDLPRATTQLQMKYGQLRTTLRDGSGWRKTLGEQMPTPVGFEDLVVRTQLEPVTTTVEADSAAPEAVAGAQRSDADAGAASGAGTPAEPIPDGANDSTATSDGNAPTPSELRASGLLKLLVGTTSSFFGLFAQFIVLIFLSLYWSLDQNSFERLWLSLLAPNKRASARSTFRQLENDVGAHIRSEFLQFVIALLMLFAGFLFLGADFALFMAWAAALVNLIPLVGWLLALIPVVALGQLTSPQVALGAAAYLLAVLALLEFVVEPRVDKRRRAGSIFRVGCRVDHAASFRHYRTAPGKSGGSLRPDHRRALERTWGAYCTVVPHRGPGAA